ncbi:inositol monophosphatase 1 [Parasteatoda tepidariorum]|uniref:inositol monophosphatase 1 n=1 Tax=Parasteatoda tepidariorum TaxID=114398 RepID=UPI00077FA00F|nr:inositol monophosphatase 1 [Parasteatoda tepidariorum]
MSDSVNIDECCTVALDLARKAGEIIRAAINKRKNIKTKISNVDLVTETDKEVEEFLITNFKSHFPDHCFIGEETTGCHLTDSPTWIIDPVDGTMNFVHRFPYTAVSIGLSLEKEIVLGIVYNPVLDKMFTGVKGKGSFCNGERLQVSGTEDLSQALILSEFGSDRSPESKEQIFQNLHLFMEKAHGIRMMGSAALNMCEVASGHADAYVEYSIHCWDMAAGKIIVEEAGGTVIDPTGAPLDLMSRRVLCSSSPVLAEVLAKELKHIQFPRDE